MTSNHETVSISIPESLAWALYMHRDSNKSDLTLPWNGNQSIKDVVESVGIPHTEVHCYYNADEEVSENYIVEPGDTLSFTPVLMLPYCQRTFLVDTHLGKLASYLRLMGFSTYYQTDWCSADIIDLIHTSGATLVTRNHELLKHKELDHGLLIHSMEISEQVWEVCYRYDLIYHVNLLTRCPHCNGEVHQVDKTEIVSQLEPETNQWYDDFYRCDTCGQIYWYGSHYTRLITLLDTIRDRIEAIT